MIFLPSRFLAPESGGIEGAPAAKRIKSEELLGTSCTILFMHDVIITSCHIVAYAHLSNPDQDELEVYGSESQTSGPSTLASYKFEVCDSILNIGPIKDMALGMPAFLSVSRLKDVRIFMRFHSATVQIIF